MANWGCCGQVREQSTRARQEKHHSKHSLLRTRYSRRLVTECLWILSLSLSSPSNSPQPFALTTHTNRRTTRASTWPLISTNVREQERADNFFQDRCVIISRNLRINVRRKKGKEESSNDENNFVAFRVGHSGNSGHAPTFYRQCWWVIRVNGL